MSRFTALLASVLLVGCAAFAQDSSTTAPSSAAPKEGHARKDTAEKRLKRMSKRLNLTDDQKEKLRPILQDEEKQMAAVDGDTALTQQQRHKKMREIRLASRSQMDPVLTDEQKKQMPSVKSGGGGHHHHPAGSTGAPSTDSASQ